MKIPRGIRNHNPGNIRHSMDRWRGMAKDQADSSFVAFEHPVYGIRALARILLTYQEQYGLNTVRRMIERWAPPEENDTDAYVTHLSDLIRISADTPIRLRENPHEFGLLVMGIVHHENGSMPYEKTIVEDGILLATAI